MPQKFPNLTNNEQSTDLNSDYSKEDKHTYKKTHLKRSRPNCGERENLESRQKKKGVLNRQGSKKDDG